MIKVLPFDDGRWQVMMGATFYWYSLPLESGSPRRQRRDLVLGFENDNQERALRRSLILVAY